MTPEGAALLQTIQQLAASLNNEMMHGVTLKEILATEDIMHRMKVRLIEMDNQSRNGVDRTDVDNEAAPSGDFIGG